MIVHPEARRRGVARALMRALEDHARQAGRTLLTLDRRTSDAAGPLCASMGYVTLGAAGAWPGDSIHRSSIAPP